MLRPGRFSAALKNRAAVRNERFALHVGPPLFGDDARPGDASALQRWCFGLAIPKRHESNAVRRNAVKRVWREAFRLDGARFAGTSAQTLVVRLVKAVTKDERRPSLAVLKRICREDAELLLSRLALRLPPPSDD